FHSYFAMLLSSPISTLLPYTTLFRSPVDEREIARVALVIGVSLEVDAERMLHACRCLRRRREFVRRAGPQLERRLVWIDERAAGDRKSTRLNSSHGSISYAVFCLKKK